MTKAIARAWDLLGDLGEFIVDSLVDFWDQSKPVALVTMILLAIGWLLLAVGLNGL